MVTAGAAPPLYLDEDVPHLLRDRLGALGFNVRLAVEVLGPATEDSKHLKTCADNSWAIITLNRGDFQRLHRYWRVLHSWELLTTLHGGIISVSGNPPLADEWASQIAQLVSNTGKALVGSMRVWDLERREWDLITVW
jgi:hypothetical protein